MIYKGSLVLSIFISLAPLAFSGCASRPQSHGATPSPIEAASVPERPVSRKIPSQPYESVGHTEVANVAAARAAQYAVKMVGTRYRFGGSSPTTGFDCSGLVQFSFRQAGVTIPRTTQQQRYASRSIRVSDLRRGDLVFFDQEGKKNSHLGMYVGDGYFVHAPSSGKRVRLDRLDSPYWRRHLSEVRRIEG